MSCELSIVSPVYQAAAIVPLLVKRIVVAAAGATPAFEVILVDDGSSDASWDRISECCERDPRVQGVKLTRNFGQHNAITAGLAVARGQFVIVLDCDLQDDPRYIPALLHKAREGYDVVLTSKRTREYDRLRNWTALGFYRVLAALGELPKVDPHINGYSLISRRVVEAYLGLNDYHRDYLMLVEWMGFHQAVLLVDHSPRHAGKSSYTLAKLLRHAVAAITAHSKALLKASIALGFLYVLVALVAMAYLVVGYFIHGYRAGWASTMVLILGSTGLMLLAIGVLGIYIGHILDQVRARPLYLVQKHLNRNPAGQASPTDAISSP